MVIQNLRKKLMALLRDSTSKKGENVMVKEKQHARVVKFQMPWSIYFPKHHKALRGQHLASGSDSDACPMSQN